MVIHSDVTTYSAKAQQKAQLDRTISGQHGIFILQCCQSHVDYCIHNNERHDRDTLHPNDTRAIFVEDCDATVVLVNSGQEYRLLENLQDEIKNYDTAIGHCVVMSNLFQE